MVQPLHAAGDDDARQVQCVVEKTWRRGLELQIVLQNNMEERHGPYITVLIGYDTWPEFYGSFGP